MTEADVIQPSASIASPGKGIRYIGKPPEMFAYAYSGDVDVNNGVTVLDFTTGSGFINGKIYMAGNWGEAGANFVLFTLDFNGLTVITIGERRDLGAGSDQPFNIIIPPLTHVEAKYAGVGVSTLFTTVITGRVYGAE